MVFGAYLLTKYMDFDYELERHYHPENFERTEDEEEEIDLEVKAMLYNIEVNNVILEAIKL